MIFIVTTNKIAHYVSLNFAKYFFRRAGGACAFRLERMQQQPVLSFSIHRLLFFAIGRHF